MKRSELKRKTPMRPGRAARPDSPTPETEEQRADRKQGQALAAMKSVVPRASRMAPAPTASVAVPKDPPPVRSVAYRMAVAQLPCYHCRREGCTQVAHGNTGKAKGRKNCDLTCFPMCHVGANDCHARFDQYKIVGKHDMADFERKARDWTVRELLRRGLWPSSFPIPDIRRMN